MTFKLRLECQRGASHSRSVGSAFQAEETASEEIVSYDWSTSAAKETHYLVWSQGKQFLLQFFDLLASYYIKLK